jgi:hypothetical protein
VTPFVEHLRRDMSAGRVAAGLVTRTAAELSEIEKQPGESPHERAITRFNQYGPLIRLGRLDDAQQVLEQCEVLRRTAIVR